MEGVHGSTTTEERDRWITPEPGPPRYKIEMSYTHPAPVHCSNEMRRYVVSRYSPMENRRRDTIGGDQLDLG